ncbi:MAG: SEL1-like repeat protein [Acidobacteriaceae bacterium]|nr:SEL1-like repeat protein [Acidobacteriaceae bacterium]
MAMTGKPGSLTRFAVSSGRFIGLAALATQVTLSQTAPGTSGHPANNAADEFFEEPAWQTICSRALALGLPPTAATLAHSAAANPAPPAGQCDEQTLYYGLGKSPDFQAALQCAYWHRAHPDVPTNSSLEGAGTLAMLYANGDGVPRDYALAIRFACEVGNKAGSNAPERIGRLEALRDGKLPSGTSFDLCDEQMSGAMGAYCSELSLKQADAGRTQRIAAVEAGLSQQAQTMLPALQAAEAAFEQARIKGEYPGGGGTGSAGFALDDQNRLREQFVINLEHFSTGKLPTASSAVRQLAQRDLDAAYAAALAVPRDPNAPFGQPTVNGIEMTEAAWQELFQQWMLFVPVAFPALSQDAVATELLRLRIHQLKKASY